VKDGCGGRGRSQNASLDSNLSIWVGVFFTEIRNRWGVSYASRQECWVAVGCRALGLREPAKGDTFGGRRNEEVMEAMAYVNL